MNPYNFSPYKSVLPQAIQSQYYPGTYIDGVFTFLNQALVPASVYVSGELVVQREAGGDVLATDPIFFNHRCGAHALFDTIKTDMNNIGNAESIEDYPSYVSVTRLGSELPLERGTTTPSAMELRVPTKGNTRALVQSAKAASPLSFCVQVQCAVNKFNQPVNYSTSGETRIRIRLADAERFLFAENDTAPTYYLKNVKFHYKVLPQEVQYQGPLTTEVINSSRQNLNSSSQTISMQITTGTTDSLVARCFLASDERNNKVDKLACNSVPGVVPGTNNEINETYGFNRIIYSVNDIDSAPINFNLETREEIIINYLRALRKDYQYKYSYLLNDNAGGPDDSYAIGVNFGGLVDFSKQSFTMNLESAIGADDYNLYMFSRSLVTVA